MISSGAIVMAAMAIRCPLPFRWKLSMAGGRPNVSTASAERFLVTQLEVVDFPVQPVSSQKFGMGALLHNPPFVHHQDHIGPVHGGNPVGNDKRRAPLHQVHQGLLDCLFGLRIYAGG